MKIQDIFSYFNFPAVGSGPTLINPGPKPLVSPFGPGYSMHPELSRSAWKYFITQSAYISLPIAVGLWSGSLYVLTASEHRTTNVIGEMSIPVTEDNPFFRR